MKRTGPTNENLGSLISELKKKGAESPLWKRIAIDLEKPTRKRRVVNLSKINRVTKENDTIVVPGKVLGTGLLNHKITIAAFQYSDGALDKLKQANAKAITLPDLLKEGINGKKVRIIG